MRNGEDLQGMARGADWPLLSKTPRAKAASPGIIPGGWKEGEDPASVLDVAPLPLLGPRKFGGTVGFQLGKGLRKSHAPWGNHVLTLLGVFGGSKGLFMLRARLKVSFSPAPRAIPCRSCISPPLDPTNRGCPGRGGGRATCVPQETGCRAGGDLGDGGGSPDSSLRTLPSPCHHCPAPPTAGFC